MKSREPCDVCGESQRERRPIQSDDGPVPMCYRCVEVMMSAALYASDKGATTEQASAFGWRFVRDERGRGKKKKG